jgi:hypothetical protein
VQMVGKTIGPLARGQLGGGGGVTLLRHDLG